MIIVLVLANVILLVTGQVLFKLGLNRMGVLTLHNALQVFVSPLILTGLFLYVVATLLWFAVLSRAQLSAVYPLQSLSYILGLAVSLWILHEDVSLTRWIGAVIILLGVALVTWSPKL
ncbi:EamA family transporter [Ferroacidibacillus organovorans]|uniref:EamA domain-containing protein n=1 Tax=Ferroacidibacillus organovorans TaxID=1765683 RepID=A0A162SE24_9BACL|nr:EamA family transporter [Ferroacidibacillus organovorans]KYP79742.1 hypothetical protein AYJ22_13875 [Ferroacidibacillus organovorans]OAG90826.1 hypothetical protein AYW79_14010 [Ferroacidibacillus organovorans]OPG15832.1 hypothetical protein B2M26_09470 [Ferroacidibacillus organovorans]